jgi:hypothetical protein
MDTDGNQAREKCRICNDLDAGGRRSLDLSNRRLGIELLGKYQLFFLVLECQRRTVLIGQNSDPNALMVQSTEVWYRGDAVGKKNL